MPPRHRSQERDIRFDGFYEDEYEDLNDRGFDHMEIVDRLERADEQWYALHVNDGFQITEYP